jgi:intermediate peptidase
MNKYLVHPEGFQGFAAITLQKARKIVAKVVEASTVGEYRAIVRDLDRLSDLLCRVIDLADFVRATHPDREIQANATKAYGLMFEYMNVLNTTSSLNEQLKRAIADPKVWNSWSKEEKVVAQILIKDFSKSAIDLPTTERQKFVDLSNEISQLGSSFTDSIAPEREYLVFESNRLKGMDPALVRQLTKWKKVKLPTVGAPAGLALRTVRDADVRREIYMANRTAARGQVQRLEGMLRRRAELARLSGYGNFAEMALTDKMAKSPG